MTIFAGSVAVAPPPAQGDHAHFNAEVDRLEAAGDLLISASMRADDSHSISGDGSQEASIPYNTSPQYVGDAGLVEYDPAVDGCRFFCDRSLAPASTDNKNLIQIGAGGPSNYCARSASDDLIYIQWEQMEDAVWLDWSWDNWVGTKYGRLKASGSYNPNETDDRLFDFNLAPLGSTNGEINWRFRPYSQGEWEPESGPYPPYYPNEWRRITIEHDLGAGLWRIFGQWLTGPGAGAPFEVTNPPGPKAGPVSSPKNPDLRFYYAQSYDSSTGPEWPEDALYFSTHGYIKSWGRNYMITKAAPLLDIGVPIP